MMRRSRSERTRLGVCLVAFLGAFVVLGMRAFGLHAASDGRVSRLSERQVGKEIVLAAIRGMVLDAKGRQLAMSLEVPSVFADPSVVDAPGIFAKKIAGILKVSPKEIRAKLKDRDRRFVWLKRRIDPNDAKKLLALDLAGLHITHEGTRLYPDRELAAQVLGVVGSEGQGLEGLERFYDRFLRSQQLTVHTEKDAKGRSLYAGDTVLVEAEPGGDLHLTLDQTIQHMAEEEITEAARASGSKHAMGIVMDPTSGKILAMASYPRVNPNRLDRSSAEDWRNRPVEEVYEPGSTFKIFSMAAALETGSIRPDEWIVCRKGSLVVSGKEIKTHVNHDSLDPRGIIKHSDNIGTGRIALRVGRQKLHDMIRKFGFGSKTQIDFPAEAKGLIDDPNRWSDVQLANVAFGQGIGVTALQLATALSTIANGGMSVRPYLVENATFPDGRALDLRGTFTPKRIISERTASLLAEWMEAVTQKDGTGVQAALDSYRTAGKTGTAQKVDTNTGRYGPDLVMSSFMGFAPVSKPRLVALFVFDEPKKADYGGTLAAPVFRKVMEGALSYLGVPSDKRPEDLPKIAQGSIFSFPSEARAELTYSDDAVPDLRGLTVREVLLRGKQISIPIRVVGSGLAVRQSPQPGSSLDALKKLTVFFSPAASGETL